MIRFVEAFASAVPNATQGEVVLVFSQADLESMVTIHGKYQPMTASGLVIDVGTLDKITKMVCRSTKSPDILPTLIFKSTAGLTIAQFDEMFAHGTTIIPTLPKLPALGGYEVVLTCDTAGGPMDVSWLTKGGNSFGAQALGIIGGVNNSGNVNNSDQHNMDNSPGGSAFGLNSGTNTGAQQIRHTLGLIPQPFAANPLDLRHRVPGTVG